MKELNWETVEKHILTKCKVNDNLAAVNVNELMKKFGTTRQNIHHKLDRMLKNNDGFSKVGEYILIKIKK